MAALIRQFRDVDVKIRAIDAAATAATTDDRSDLDDAADDTWVTYRVIRSTPRPAPMTKLTSSL
jgi:hypothetical protein